MEGIFLQNGSGFFVHFDDADHDTLSHTRTRKDKNKKQNKHI